MTLTGDDDVNLETQESRGAVDGSAQAEPAPASPGAEAGTASEVEKSSPRATETTLTGDDNVNLESQEGGDSVDVSAPAEPAPALRGAEAQAASEVEKSSPQAPTTALTGDDDVSLEPQKGCAVDESAPAEPAPASPASEAPAASEVKGSSPQVPEKDEGRRVDVSPRREGRERKDGERRRDRGRSRSRSRSPRERHRDRGHTREQSHRDYARRMPRDRHHRRQDDRRDRRHDDRPYDDRHRYDDRYDDRRSSRRSRSPPRRSRSPPRRDRKADREPAFDKDVVAAAIARAQGAISSGALPGLGAFPGAMPNLSAGLGTIGLMANPAVSAFQVRAGAHCLRAPLLPIAPYEPCRASPRHHAYLLSQAALSRGAAAAGVGAAAGIAAAHVPTASAPFAASLGSGTPGAPAAGAPRADGKKGARDFSFLVTEDKQESGPNLAMLGCSDSDSDSGSDAGDGPAAEGEEEDGFEAGSAIDQLLWRQKAVSGMETRRPGESVQQFFQRRMAGMRMLKAEAGTSSAKQLESEVRFHAPDALLCAA